MAWIESHEELGEHWKVHQLSEHLNCTVPTVVGHLHLLWHYTLKVAWRDGDLSKFPKQEIARACRFDGDSEVYIKALQTCGFLDDMRVHQWLDYAGRIVYERLYNEKRRLKNNRKTTVKQPRKHRNTSSTVPNRTVPNHKEEEEESPLGSKDPPPSHNGPTPEDLWDLWKKTVGPLGLPVPRSLTPMRKEKAKKRLLEHPERSFWGEVMKKIERSKFLQGDSNRGWKVDFDFLVANQENVLKIVEGKYDDKKRY